MNCQDVRKLLPMLSDLQEEKTQEIRMHALGCEQCARKLREWEAVCGEMRSWQEEEAPEEFLSGWRNAIREEKQTMKENKRWRAWTAAAAAVVLLVSGTAIFKDSLPGHMDSVYGVEEAAGGVMYSMARSASYDEGAMPELTEDFSAYQENGAEMESVILRSASISLESVRFDETMEEIRRLYAACGGWAQNSSLSGKAISENGNGRYASLTLRIPQNALDAFVEDLRECGNVTYLHMSQEDVSDSYYDTQSRLDMYRAQHARLLELMEEAESMEDILVIEERASELQYSIDSLEGNLRTWKSRADNAEVYVNLEEIAEAASEEAGLWQKIQAGAIGSWQNLVEFLKDMLVFAASALPWLGCFGAAGYLLSLPIRKWRKMRRKDS